MNPVTLEPYRDRNGLCQIAGPGEVGMMMGEIKSYLKYTSFIGYTSKEETSKKVIRDIINQGDYAFVSGDLMKLDDDGNVFFNDRTGDTFRWKGENVSTTEVESIASKIVNFRKCAVYGVAVPHCDGNAGMIAIESDSKDAVDLVQLYKSLKEQLPDYAIPKFVRLTNNIDTTSTYKYIKYQLRNEGIDPAKILAKNDHIFYYDKVNDGYRVLDSHVHQQILEEKIKF